MYEASGAGAQLHDFNPGIAQSGLFWTTAIDENAVHADLSVGTATFELQNARMNDYISFDNAVNGGGPTPRPGVVSFRVAWTAIEGLPPVDVPEKRFHGEHAFASAQMEWTGRSGDYEFASHPINTSSSQAALLGLQRTGSFYA